MLVRAPVGRLEGGHQAGIRLGDKAVPARDSLPALTAAPRLGIEAAHIRADGGRLPWRPAEFTADQLDQCAHVLSREGSRERDTRSRRFASLIPA